MNTINWSIPYFIDSDYCKIHSQSWFRLPLNKLQSSKCVKDLKTFKLFCMCYLMPFEEKMLLYV